MMTGRKAGDHADLELPDDSGGEVKKENTSKTSQRLTWLNQILDDYLVHDGAFKVAFVISTKINKELESWQHQRTISERLNKTDKSIRESIEILAKRKHLSISKRGSGNNNVYTLIINDMSVEERTAAQEAAAGLGASGKPKQKGRPKGAQPAPPVEEAPPTKPPVEMVDWDPDEVMTERFENGSPDLGTPPYEAPRLAEIIGDDGANPREILIARFMAVYPKNATGHVEGLARGGFFIQVQRGADPEVIIQAAAAYTREANEKGFYGTNRVMPPHQWLAKRPWIDAGLTPPPGHGEGDPDE